MSIFKTKLFFVLLLIALQGCSDLPRSVVTKDQTSTVIGLPITYEYFDSRETNTRFFLNAYNASSNRKATRNSILFELMGLVDQEFDWYTKALRSDRAHKDTIVSILSITLTGAATIAGGSTPQLLAAIDTGIKGSNAAVDLNVFRDKTSEILINKMNSQRALIATSIYQSMRLDVEQYPLQAGIRDIGLYFSAGSVTSALTALAASTAEEAGRNISEAATVRRNANQAAATAPAPAASMPH